MKTRNVVARMGVFVFALGFGCLSLKAQFTSGVEGTVLDPSGAAVPNASVTIKSDATGEKRNIQTSTSGYFRFSSLPTATFNLTIEATGFRTALFEKIPLGANETRTINTTLELGKASTEINVSAAPPPVELAEARVSGFVDATKVHDLPLVGRNFYSLVVLTPGIVGLPSGGGQAYAQATADIFNAEYGVNLSSAGQRAEANDFMVDSASVNSAPRGGVSNITPNADSVQEVRILVNNFSAEYGRNAGAIVNVISKQGTNEYHGTLSWFHTDNAITARNVFQHKVPVFRRNEGAWSFGGPIVKNRTFAFASMDILRSGVGFTSTPVVQTPEFTNFLIQNLPNNISTFLLKTFPLSFAPNRGFKTAGDLTRNPLTTKAYNCSADLTSPSDPILTPIGNLPCNFKVFGTGEFSSTIPRNGVQWNARVDHNWNDFKDRLYGNVYRTTRQTVAFAQPSIYLPRFSPIEPQYAMLTSLNWTHTISPNALNEMGAGYTRTFGDDTCDHCEVPFITITPLTAGLGGPGTGFIGTFTQNNYEWRDVVTLNHGTHTFKFGALAQQQRATTAFTLNYLRPSFSFVNIFDFANDTPFSESNITFDPRTGAQGTNDLTLWQTTIGLFAQNDWKVRRNLTLNLGIRWESFGNPTEQNNRLSNVIFQGGSDFFARITDLKVDVLPHLLHGTDKNNWAPRFGFAWDPTGRGKLAIRGGFGMFYDRFSNQFWQNLRTNPPLFATATASVQTPPFTPVFGLGASGQPPFNFPQVPTITAGLDSKNGLLSGKASLSITDPNLRVQYGENWSLGFQYAFSQSWVVESYYLGSAGHKLHAAYDVNRFAGDLVQDGKLNRLNQSFGSIVYGQSNFNSAYHGGTVAVRNRTYRGLNFQSAYTFGKGLDQASSFGPGLSVSDPTNLHLQRGVTDFDIRQRLSFSLLYNLPKRNFGMSMLNTLLNGWELGNITILQSGSPFSVFCNQAFKAVKDVNGNIVGNTGCDYNGDGFNFDVPLAPSFNNGDIGHERSDFLAGIFKASDFPVPGLGQEGNLGRNTFIGPGFANTDFNVTKNTKSPWFWGAEGANVQFRAEFFNFFNRVNLSNPVGNLVSSQFGQATSTFPARNIQFGLRIEF